MSDLVGVFRTSGLGDSISGNPERTASRRRGRIQVIQRFCNKGQVVWTSKDYCSLKKTRYPKLRNLALFYEWEDARVWAHWNHSFDMHLSCRGQYTLFISWIYFPRGSPFGVAAIWWPLDGRYSSLSEFPQGSQAHHPWWLQLLVTTTSLGEGSGTPLQFSCLENPMDNSFCWRRDFILCQ